MSPLSETTSLKRFSKLIGPFGIALAAALVLLSILNVQPLRAANWDVPVGGSIQAAIDNAAPGDTVRVESGTFTESLVITKSLTLLGGYTSAFTIRNPRTTLISPTVGRGIKIAGLGADVIVDGFEIANANVGIDGGGILVDVADDSRIIINNNDIHDNSANSGGGIYADTTNRSALRITNNDIMTNTSTGNYGGLYANSFMSGTLVISGNNIVNNQAGTSYGGFSANVMYFGQFSVERNLVMSNTATTGATSNGGFGLSAMFNTHGTFDGNQMIGNQAANSYGGGAVDIMFSSSSTLYDNAFRRNVAGSVGGLGLTASYNSNLIGDGLVIVENQANSSINGGLQATAQSDASIDLPNTVITGNQAQGSNGGGAFVINQNATLNITDALVEGNRSATGTSGGLLLNAMMNSGITATQMAVISNTAYGEGGGIMASAIWNSNVDLTNSTFERNHAITSTNGAGGGLYASALDQQASIDLSGSRFLTNTAGAAGGGAFASVIQNNSALLLNNTTFVSNTAGSDGGGLLISAALFAGQVQIDASHFERNRAQSGGGGGVAVGTNYGQLSLSNSDFIHNRATSGGGGLYVGALIFAADVQIDANTFYANAVDSTGGAAFVGTIVGGQTTINGNQILSNTATSGIGGGMYLGSVLSGSDVEAISNTISSNVASSDGGGLFLGAVDGSHLLLNTNVITDNQSGGIGGGVYLGTIGTASSVDFLGNQVNGNQADIGGGFLLIGGLQSGANLTMRDNEFLDNTAKVQDAGCGVWSAVSGSQLFFEGNLVNRNVSDGFTGGCRFWNFTSGTLLSLRDNQFNHNKAGTDYGGLLIDTHVLGTQVDVIGNQIIGNQAGITDTLPTATGGRAGGVYLSAYAGSQATLIGNEIRDNTAYTGTGPFAGQNGGIYAFLESTLLTLQDNTIGGNTAQDSFGGLHVEMLLSRLDLAQNVITGNLAITEAGGVRIHGGANSQYSLQRNQIVNNSAGAQDGLSITAIDPTLWGTSENNLVAGNQGSGVYLQDADFHSTNDTIASNMEYGITMSGTLTSTAYLSNTILWNHTWPFSRTQVITYTDRFTMSADYSDVEGDWAGVGNINQDPLFVGGGDYHLQGGSPAIDRGNNAVAPPVDLDGVPRPVPAGGAVDLGAYEYRMPGVDVVGDGSLSGDPASVVSHTVTITNTGDAEDLFKVSLSGQTWTTTLSLSQLILGAGNGTQLQVYATVPPDRGAGDSDTVDVVAASQRNAMVVDADTLTTVANHVPDVSLTPDRTAGTLPGSTVVYEHTLSNRGNGADTLQLSTISSQGWKVTLNPYAATLPAGDSRTVWVYVSVPSSATPGATDVTTVTATSMADGSIFHTAIDTTTAQPWPYSNYLPITVRNRP